MISYKGFDKNFRCRDMQYQVGQTYALDGQLKICEHGLHFCDTPLAVFEFYPPANSRFAVVEALGEIVSDEDNPHKFCTDKLKVIRELSLIEFVAEIKGAATNTGDRSAAIDTGKNSKAKANIGSWLVLSEWKNNIRSDVQVFKVDGEKILPDTFYTLKDGQPVKVQEDEL